MWLRQSTASQEILLGTFHDSTDGDTEETGLTIANTDIKLWKNGTTAQVNKNSGGATHDANGRYYAVLDATDSDTLGNLEINVHVAGALSVRREFMVVPANVYDSLILGTDTLTADLTQIDGVAQSATDLKDFADAGYDPATNKVQGVVLVDTSTTLTNLPSITSNWITAAGIEASAMDGKGDWNVGKTGYSLTQGFPTNFADQAITATTGLVSVGTNNDKAGYSISGTKQTLDALNDLTAAQVNAEADTALADYAPNTVAPDNTSITAILADTADMQPKIGAPATDLSADIAAVKVDTAATLVDTGTTLPATLGSPAGADMSTDIAAIKTETASIQTDTTNLRGVFKQNTAISNIEFLMIDSTDDVSPITGLTVTGQRSIDGGAFANVSGTIAEVGSGIYQFDALAADTNGGVITYKFAATGANDRFVTIHTTA